MEKGAFIKLDYTGKLADGTIFDTTDERVAQEAGLTGERFGPVTICLGEGMLLRALEAALTGRKKGRHTIALQNGFGKKDAKLLRIVPEAQLRKQGIRAAPGMQLTIDGHYGVVKSAGGGRVVVDFNHPLASQDVTYDVDIIEEVTDPAEQVRALLPAGTRVAVEDGRATITLAQVPPKPIMDAIQQKITKLTQVKTVTFEARKE